MRQRMLCIVLVLWLAGTALPAIAQSPASVTQNFETQPLTGWTLPPSASVEPVGRSNALVFHGPGMAVTPFTCGQSFTFTCQLQVQSGAAAIAFCASGDGRRSRWYQLWLNREEAVLVRHEAGAEQELGGGEWRLAGTPWAQLTIARTGGQIQVSIGGSTITAQDPSPLPDGGMQIGQLRGAGAVYDDIAFSGGWTTVQPAMPINLPEMVNPGQPTPTSPMPGPLPVQPVPVGEPPAPPAPPAVAPMTLPEPMPMPSGEPQSSAPRQGTLQPQPGPGMVPAVPMPFPSAQPAPPRVSPQAAARLAVMPSRALVVHSLSANPATANQLQAVPQVRAVGLHQLASVATDGSPVWAAGGGGTPDTAAAVGRAFTSYPWQNGATFRFFQAASQYTAGGSNWSLGALSVEGAALRFPSGLLEAGGQAPLLLDGRFSLSLVLELPPQPGTYAVTFQITDRNGSFHPEWLGEGDALLGELYWTWAPGDTGGYSKHDLTPLQDGTGCVGIMTVTQPGSFPGHLLPETQMRDVNCIVWLRGNWADLDGFAFGGVTVTKL